MIHDTPPYLRSVRLPFRVLSRNKKFRNLRLTGLKRIARGFFCARFRSIILFASFCTVAIGAEPLFDIPRIDGVTIDAKDGDWNSGGFRVETLNAQSGDLIDPKNFDAKFRLSWDERGLLILITVSDDKVADEEQPKDLPKKDGIEIVVGSNTANAPFFHLMTGTGADGTSSVVRTFITALTKPGEPVPFDAEIAGARTSGGYVLEARLPWSALGIEPKPGTEIAFFLAANDVDGEGSRVSLSWYDRAREFKDTNAMHRVRLAKAASPPVRMSTRVTLDQGRPRVDVVAAGDCAGGIVKARTEGKIVATSTFEAVLGRARASFLLPVGNFEISSEGTGVVNADCRDFGDAISRALANARVVFKPSVFSGEKFPPCGFLQPAEVERTLGKCTLTPVFYDASYRVVTRATAPGRYGAIVQGTTAGGQTFQRFITLYRTPQEVDWKRNKVELGSVKFPPELGLDPAVVSERMESVEGLVKEHLFTNINEGSDTAVLFAAFSEMKAGSEPPHDRNGSYALNQKWWYGLKKQTGNLRTDFYVHVPASYNGDPTKRWPLILFLHGSGERGFDLNLVKKNGLPRDLDTTPDFPFIVIAPQCSPGEWWSPFELNDLLDRVEASYRVDKSRVYLTGLSMGGYGSWTLAMESPRRFAAVVPVCGGGDPSDVERIKDVPIWVFHGGKDNSVPLERSQVMVDALKKIGSQVKFTIFPEAGHDSWTQAYADPKLYEWLLQQARPED